MKLVVWTVSGQHFAIETSSIAEVVPVVEVRSVPGTPTWVRGLMDYRGILIPLLDVRALLGGDATKPRRASRVLIVRMSAGLIGLLVDTVRSVERGQTEQGHPGFASEETPFLGPIVRTADGTVQLVTPERLLSDEQRELLFSRAAGDAS